MYIYPLPLNIPWDIRGHLHPRLGDSIKLQVHTTNMTASFVCPLPLLLHHYDTGVERSASIHLNARNYLLEEFTAIWSTPSFGPAT